MKLGVHVGYWGLGMGPRDQLRVVQQAERLGYDSVWTAEAYGSDAASVLAWLAAQTTTLKLGSAIFQMPGRSRSARPLASEAASATAPLRRNEALPELANVYWRPRTSERSLTRTGRVWTATTLAHVLPFLATAVCLILLSPITSPVGLAAAKQAWIIPELYAARGQTWCDRAAIVAPAAVPRVASRIKTPNGSRSGFSGI